VIVAHAANRIHAHRGAECVRLGRKKLLPPRPEPPSRCRF
jgi:hypothetical protein